MINSNSIPFSDFLNFIFELGLLLFSLLKCIFLFVVKSVAPPRLTSVEGEIVLVTGAAHGIGHHLAMQLASLRAIVVCLDKDKEGNNDTAQKIRARGHQSYAYTCDVSNRSSVQDTAIMITKEVGIVTFIINNAAIHNLNPLMVQSSEDILEEINTNLMSQFWILQAFLPSMIDSNHGHVVCISSMCGVAGVKDMVPYCTSKFAVSGLMDSLGEEMRAYATGVKVTTVYPFYVDTGMARDPAFRFPLLFSAVSPTQAASDIIQGVLRGYTEFSIPKILLPAQRIIR
uniref:Short-chain dehydrogenase/reductase 3 n=1 Tax=Timema californicum TaxID=61474 RepID=A0A7R9PB70_TIMCA|nr:unnamed protein product [Timema californicum]